MASCGSKLDNVYSYVDGKIGGLFAKYGRFVSRHAWKVLIISLIINGGLSVGMVALNRNIDAEDNYFPLDSEARRDRDRVESLYPDLSGSNYNSLQLTTLGAWASVYIKSKTGNLLSRTALTDVQALDTLIQATTATSDSGATISYTDICAKANSQCVVNGELFISEEFLNATDSGSVTYPVFMTASGAEYYATDLAGVVTTNPAANILTGMEYITLKYNMRTDNTSSDHISTQWVHAFQKSMKSFSSTHFDIAYGHFKSLEEELDENVNGDILLFAGTLAIMIVYACAANVSASCDNVGQRVLLGYAGVLAAGLAIPASFGLGSALGLDFVSIAGVVPFLVIGIGIDDMFILLSGLAGAQSKTTIEEKMAETMRTSGVGITITSLTDLLAFMAGASSKFLSVRNFCIYSGMAVIFCYLNNLTLFASCCVINERRVQNRRHYFTCRPVKTREEYIDDNHSRGYAICCGGTIPKSREESESYLDKLPRWLIPKIVLNLPCKIIICLSFAGYLVAAIYGSINLKQGLEFKQLVPEDSYYYSYAIWTDDVFSSDVPVSFVIDKTYTYSDANVQTKVDDLISSAQSDSYFNDNYKVSWLTTYNGSAYYDDTSEVNFIAGLKQFFANPTFRRFENDVVIDDATKTIKSSRVYALSVDIESSQQQGKFMTRSREIADAASLSCFAYHSAFPAFEQFNAILSQTLQTVGIALVAVFFIMCIFMPHPLLIVYVTVVVAMIMCGVVGFLLYMDLTLSTITMIHIIMCIGFSVDFAAHTCHSFMVSSGASRDERVKGAIDKTGAPIFHGAMSSLLGVVILFAANSYIFRTFAQVLSMVLAFGVTHALLLLPVVLSWIGPGKLNSVSFKNDKDTTNESKDNFAFSDNDIRTDIEVNGLPSVMTSDIPEKTKQRTTTYL